MYDVDRICIQKYEKKKDDANFHIIVDVKTYPMGLPPWDMRR